MFTRDFRLALLKPCSKMYSLEQCGNAKSTNQYTKPTRDARHTWFLIDIFFLQQISSQDQPGTHGIHKKGGFWTVMLISSILINEMRFLAGMFWNAFPFSIIRGNKRLILEKHLVDDKLLVVQHNALEVQHKMHWKCSTKCVGSAAQNALECSTKCVESAAQCVGSAARCVGCAAQNALEVQHKMR